MMKGNIWQAQWIAFTKNIPEFQSMITFGRFGKLREFSIAPVVIAAVYDHAANGGTMSADPFGSRFNDYICAPFDMDGTNNHLHRMYCQRSVAGHILSQVRQIFQNQEYSAADSDGFQVNGFGIFIDVLYKAFYIIAVCKAGFDPKAFESNLKLVISAAI